MKSVLKVIAIFLATVIGLGILIVAGYVIYVAVQYYRIDDNVQLEIVNTTDKKVAVGKEYSIATYNLGFGAYSPEYSFFMDTGVMNDGREVEGKYAKGLSKEDVIKNVEGQKSYIENMNADFCFLQEVDEDADRSYHVNMKEEICSAFTGYLSVYAENFHTATLFYPLSDPIGKSESGILTLSKYCVQSSVRRSFPVSDGFPDKFFDLDRCFTVNYLPIENCESFLVLINLHMSAYDEGGKIRAQQLEKLNTVIKLEYTKGNYVIAGGDFNHCLIADMFQSDEEALSHFPSGQKVPDWVKNSVLHNKELANGFKIAAPINAATCRGADIPYEKGVNYTTVIDGFLYSENVEAVKITTAYTQYEYSDHNPVTFSFKLK